MRTSRSLRTLVATLVASGALTLGTVASAGTAAAGDNGSVWGVVVSRGEINLRSDPDANSAIVGSLRPGAQERIECATLAGPVNGNPYWYWLSGARGWASGAYMKPERQAPMCDSGRNHQSQNHQNRHDENRHDQNQNRHDWNQSGQNQNQSHNQNRDQWQQHRNDSNCSGDCDCDCRECQNTCHSR
ncbi:SH3 domain-containing protein [Streptomyces boluensis]|uniref:SH3b domain-containing protein n=1 Tax=Streptomyces boluensis TaxID=1775135 RepID=A0A964UUY6_9ACTN|nr:SH3 domain-containing protein [Streptomyces boluensis]NBE54976.1 hypothetical protein [Streptomyces boluensis]